VIVKYSTLFTGWSVVCKRSLTFIVLSMSNLRVVRLRRLFNGALWNWFPLRMTYHTDTAEIIRSSVDIGSADYKVNEQIRAMSHAHNSADLVAHSFLAVRCRFATVGKNVWDRFRPSQMGKTMHEPCLSPLYLLLFYFSFCLFSFPFNWSSNCQLIFMFLKLRNFTQWKWFSVIEERENDNLKCVR